MNYVDVKLPKQKGRKSTIKAPPEDDQVLYSSLMFTEKNLGGLDYIHHLVSPGFETRNKNVG